MLSGIGVFIILFEERNMELVIKIAAVGIIVAVLQQILSRSGRDEYAMLVVLAGLIAVVAMLIPELKELYSSASSVFGM